MDEWRDLLMTMIITIIINLRENSIFRNFPFLDAKGRPTQGKIWGQIICWFFQQKIINLFLNVINMLLVLLLTKICSENIKFQCVFWPFLSHFLPFLRPQKAVWFFHFPRWPPLPRVWQKTKLSPLFFIEPFSYQDKFGLTCQTRTSPSVSSRPCPPLCCSHLPKNKFIICAMSMLCFNNSNRIWLLYQGSHSRICSALAGVRKAPHSEMGSP